MTAPQQPDPDVQWLRRMAEEYRENAAKSFVRADLAGALRQEAANLEHIAFRLASSPVPPPLCPDCGEELSPTTICLNPDCSWPCRHRRENIGLPVSPVPPEPSQEARMAALEVAPEEWLTSNHALLPVLRAAYLAQFGPKGRRAMSGPRSVGEALPVEQARCRELLGAYKAIGPAGMFGATLIEQGLAEADQALASGDVLAILCAYEKLKGFE